MSYLLKLVILHSKSEATCRFISQNMFWLVVWDPWTPIFIGHLFPSYRIRMDKKKNLKRITSFALILQNYGYIYMDLILAYQGISSLTDLPHVLITCHPGPTVVCCGLLLTAYPPIAWWWGCWFLPMTSVFGPQWAHIPKVTRASQDVIWCHMMSWFHSEISMSRYVKYIFLQISHC